MRPKVPATRIRMATSTTRAMIVRPSDWKIAPMGFLLLVDCVDSAKSVSRPPQYALRSALFQALAVARHCEAEGEVNRRSEQVSLDAESRPFGILQRDLDGAQEVEQPDDQHQRGVLEQADEGIHQRRDG